MLWVFHNEPWSPGWAGLLCVRRGVSPLQGGNSLVKMNQGSADGKVRPAWGGHMGRCLPGGFLPADTPQEAASGTLPATLHPPPPGHSLKSVAFVPEQPSSQDFPLAPCPSTIA